MEVANAAKKTATNVVINLVMATTDVLYSFCKNMNYFGSTRSGLATTVPATSRLMECCSLSLSSSYGTSTH